MNLPLDAPIGISTDTLPVAEIFESVQGEGTWTGTLMTFVRLAGCCVGVPYPVERYVPDGHHHLQIYQEKCTTLEGIEFPCDTDYRVKERLTIAEILEHPLVAQSERLLITGGEPLIHPKLAELIDGYMLRRATYRRVHIETSGTRFIAKDIESWEPWICVSPKRKCLISSLRVADEIKVLIGPQSDIKAFEHSFLHYLNALGYDVFVQPIDYGPCLKTAQSLEKCMEIIHKHKQVRLSAQLHKFLGVR